MRRCTGDRRHRSGVVTRHSCRRCTSRVVNVVVVVVATVAAILAVLCPYKIIVFGASNCSSRSNEVFRGCISCCLMASGSYRGVMIRRVARILRRAAGG